MSKDFFKTEIKRMRGSIAQVKAQLEKKARQLDDLELQIRAQRANVLAVKKRSKK
ncbi:MAG TPA: hypothetical protein VKJ65_12965 [Phycisphaerae bacterium]|nr:hypothetical protein [Phycisphaerae bacterium]